MPAHIYAHKHACVPVNVHGHGHGHCNLFLPKIQGSGKTTGDEAVRYVHSRRNHGHCDGYVIN
jgi:hypothetical protein